MDHHQKESSHNRQKDSNIAKKSQNQQLVISCEKCTKIFTDQIKYQTHLKSKHSSEIDKLQKQQQQYSQLNSESKQEKVLQKKPPKKIPFKNRMMEIHQNELEDNIYAFLGELGQKNAQPTNNRSDLFLSSDNQRLTGQTNYSLNKVVRTPYEQPIKATENLPITDIAKSPYIDFLTTLKSQIKTLEDKIQAEKQIWELRDPMAPEEETLDQFSLMDIRKLIMNYSRRNLHLKHPHFSIYMLWIARICKPPAFKQFFMIIGTYLAKYESIPQNQAKDQNCYETWKNYFKQNENKLIEKELVDSLQICDDKNYKKFIQYFVEWAASFRAIVISQ